MNVLFIPSWLPYRDAPLAGKFFVEQATALAEADVARIMMLNWGQNEYQMAIRHPVSSLKKLFRYPGACRGNHTLSQTLEEVRVPHLTWTSLIAKGNITSLASRINLPRQAELIHAHVTFPAGYLAMLLSEKLSIPYIITEHSGRFPFPEYVKHGAISPLIMNPLKSASKIVAVSSHLQQEIKAKTGLEAQVIPNLVNTCLYKPGCCSHREGPFRLFSLSVISAAKGSSDLLKALKLLNTRVKDWHLYWGGDGPLLPKVKREAEKNGLRGHITWMGRLNPSQAIEQFTQCDCFVMPSRLESFSMVLIEALACGKPVVATNCGGPKDIVNDQCGILVPNQNIEAMANALEKMSYTYSGYSSQALRDYCILKFGHKAITAKIGDMYRSILDAGSGQ